MDTALNRTTQHIMDSYERYELIYETVQRIPYGFVATYGQIATLAGLPRRARLVGTALFMVRREANVPWHRVINVRGQISHSPARNGNDVRQRELLEAEGVVFNRSGYIDMTEYQWQPDEGDGP